jgi:hypothetical protein
MAHVKFVISFVSYCTCYNRPNIKMRPAPWLHLEPYRQHLPNWEKCPPGSRRGFFLITAYVQVLKVVVSEGDYKEVYLQQSRFRLETQ